MSYENPTQPVSDFRTMLFACPTVIGYGWTTAKYHYPQATLTDDAGAVVDALPLFEVEDDQPSFDSNIAGGTPLGNGNLRLTFAATLTAGQMEAVMQSIAKELRAQQTGLPITSVRVEKASDITLAAQAAQDSPDSAAGQVAYRTCSMLISYGLSY